MEYFAIQRKSDGCLVTGTDFGYPHRQLVENETRPLLLTGYTLESELLRRKVDLSRYQIVKVTIEPRGLPVVQDIAKACSDNVKDIKNKLHEERRK